MRTPTTSSPSELANQAAGPSPAAIDRILADARAVLTRLDPVQAWEAVRGGAVLVDVRTGEQREREGSIPGAVPVSLNVLEWRADPTSAAHDPRLGDVDVPLIVLCGGYCSSLAAARLAALGRQATDVVGGFDAWRTSAVPIVR